MILITPPFDDKKSEYHDGQQESYCKTQLEQEQAYIGDNETDTTTLAPGQHLQGTAFKFRTLEEIVKFEPGTINNGLLASFESYDRSHPTLPSISLTSLDVNRWKMAWRASQLYREDDEVRLCYRRMGLQQRCENWPDIWEVLDEAPIALGFIAAAFFYGGLHALAWFAHFDSYTEQLLWRVSACVVMGGLPPIFFLIKFALPTALLIARLASVSDLLEGCIIWSLLLPVYVWISAYALARAYLVVECFINLSHLPAGVYDVPSWAAYFPHIS